MEACVLLLCWSAVVRMMVIIPGKGLICALHKRSYFNSETDLLGARKGERNLKKQRENASALDASDRVVCRTKR